MWTSIYSITLSHKYVKGRPENLSFSMLKEVIKWTGLPVELRARPGQLEAPHPSLILRIYILTTISTLGPISRAQA